jgi:hypothetical protein
LKWLSLLRAREDDGEGCCYMGFYWEGSFEMMIL